jgi:hypothetical protein
VCLPQLVPEELPAAIFITVHPEAVSTAVMRTVEVVIALGERASEVLAVARRHPADQHGDRQPGGVFFRGRLSWPPDLLHDTYRVRAGDTILIHAAACGVGLIMSQWAKHLGATVIGTVGSRDKAARATQHGCDHVVVYTEEDFVARVRAITGGKGVPVVYDSVAAPRSKARCDACNRAGCWLPSGKPRVTPIRCRRDASARWARCSSPRRLHCAPRRFRRGRR